MPVMHCGKHCSHFAVTLEMPGGDSLTVQTADEVASSCACSRCPVWISVRHYKDLQCPFERNIVSKHVNGNTM